MKTEDFDYTLPRELIAQYPSLKRDESRLLHLDKKYGAVSHHRFTDLPSLLSPGDRLVFNDTKVVPARLFCRKETGARIEFLILEKTGPSQWKAMAKPLKRLRSGMKLSVEKNPGCKIAVRTITRDGHAVVQPADSCTLSLAAIVEQFGDMPLPPYIRRHAGELDKERYQTVYAANPGAVAAPTAGLHFTPQLMQKLHDAGIEFSFVTLAVGMGTFLPVKEADPRRHPMHTESYVVGDNAAAEISETRKKGNRIIAVGTTVVRVCEHCAGSIRKGKGSQGHTSLMILPGYTYGIIDALITNFHLPRSTLLMLVCAFASTQNVLAAYREAVAGKYRFYSYGDAMLIT
ncbi:MAG: tRNA preQ1(34) S-adenosylmethionine ribosyltransferase-isomerase QueA [Chitinivibrionales bacterium]|nr:tRNA preQ1(34) S-adenosylmethionine ribosyltransferase-isomerase QueA [Chitinivibrionales bacterium]